MGGGGEQEPCVLCGSTSCGGYVKPTYKCRRNITKSCDKCHNAGFPGLKHARVGPRAMVNGRIKTCEEHRADATARRRGGGGGGAAGDAAPTGP